MTCSAIILAGGQGQRMGGVDKGLMQWHNKPLIAHIIERLTPQVDEIIISCNRNMEQYKSFGYRCIKDTSDDFLGPLAGIASGIEISRYNSILVCPCDTPLIPLNLLQQLENTMQQSGASAVIACDNRNQHYSHALLTKEFAKTASGQLLTKKRALKSWYETTHWRCAAFDNSNKAFTNINTLEQLTPN
jgi:molybdopterin-guanine dinucleotide biosynthesis protein A